jgi:hypothetical protein
MGKPLAVGDYYPVWWETYSTPPNMARVLEISPYRGAYKQHFDAVLHLDMPSTKVGRISMTVSLAAGSVHGKILNSPAEKGA